MQRDLLKSKVALITGGGSGICKGITEKLLRHGCSCVITSRTEAKLAAAADELQQRVPGSTCLYFASDVRDPKSLERVVQATVSKLGGLDILVCGAAGNFLAPAAKLSANAFSTVVDIDLKGTFNSIKAAFPELKKSGGCVINISATLQYHGTPFQVRHVQTQLSHLY